jgi:hypothetical protein
MFEPRDPEDFVPRGNQEEEEAVPSQRIQEGIGSYHINEADRVDEYRINTQSEETNGENPITGGPVAEVLGLQLKASCRGIPIASVMPAAVSEDLIIHNLKAQETESDDDIRCSSGEREYVGSCTYSEEVNAVRGASTFERQEEAVNEESQTAGSSSDSQTYDKQTNVYDNCDQEVNGTDQDEEPVIKATSQDQSHTRGERESGGREPPLWLISGNNNCSRQTRDHAG